MHYLAPVAQRLTTDSILAILTGLLNYKRLEQVLTATLFVLLAAYLVVAGVSTPPPVEVARG